MFVKKTIIFFEKSEKVGFLHNSHEFLFANFSISISVSLVYHLLDLVVSHIFTEFFGHTLQVLE